jgi:hypothetical protein
MATTFSNKCEILTDIWENYEDSEALKDFISFNDIGLPLAYAHTHKYAMLSAQGIASVEETWKLLLETIGTEDYDFENFSEVLESV